VNKHFKYFLAADVLLLLLAAFALGVPPENLPFYIVLVALSVLFSFFLQFAL